MKILHLPLILCTLLYASTLHAQLSINEFMADNGSTIADENGDYEDWIEIFNAGSSSVDIGGYYISDDLTNPTLWQIPSTDPSNTTIPAGGFLLLWADKDTGDGSLHIDIKLGSGGEDIVLLASDGITVIDQLSFGPQSTDISYGRTLDGGIDFQLFTSPTPSSSNEVSQPTPTFSTTINAIVETVNDDAIQYGTSGGNVNIDHYGMTMVETWNNQTIGIRFGNILIPQGATVTNATIQFSTKSPENSTGDSNLDIKGQLSADAAPFQEVSQNISSRPTTNSTVNWQPEEWLLDFERGDKQQTPNIAPLIQEIIDQNSWESGNAMAFVISGEGQRSANNFTSGDPSTIQIQVEIPIPTMPISNIYINEISPNGTDFADEHGGYEDWIELYNDNDFPVSLGGLYLTDDIDDLTKWQIASVGEIPANGHLNVFADDQPYLGGLHATFKLSDDGETLALVQALDNQLIIIDSISYPSVPFKATAGRISDGADEWVIFGEQTPVAPNAAALPWLAAPDISLDHGVFNSPQVLTITHEDPSVTIRFTTDSSLPDENSAVYSGEITVNETQSIRARAFKNGHEPSQTKTRNYLFDASPTLPVLMITTDPDNLWDDEFGIYTIGTNGIELGDCSNNVVANFWQDWERPANLTLFQVDGEEAFSVNAGIKISGNCSRRYALKSLNIYLRNNRYGDKDIDYKLFPNRDFKKYKRLRLRNSGQDYRSTMFRDGVNHRMLADITDVEYQNFKPTLVYINGEYFGIQNFKDLYGGDYFDAFHDVPEEELDLIKNPRLGHDVKEGTDVHYNNLFSFVENNDLSEDSNYEYFKTQFDINNLIDYWISMIYMSSSDWPANNLQIWRPRTPEGKWRHVYIDTDATTSAYGSNSNTGPARDTYEKVLDGNQVGWPYDSKSTLFIRSLLENQAFNDEYIQRTCSFVELVFNPTRVDGFIDEAANAIDAEIGRHTEHWAFDNPYLEDYDDWTGKVDSYRSFFEQRPNFIYHLLAENFDLSDTYELSFNYDENTNGDVVVNWNQMEVPYNYTGTYFTGIPLQITAIAHNGYVFSHWLETGETDPTINFIANFDETLTPIFELLAEVCDPSAPGFLDEDGDGVCDPEDECPGFDDTVDINNNSIPDGCETCVLIGDDDNDGVCNDEDQCPGFDDTIDTNNNGIPDGCESCPDDDNDGVCNDEDQCPGFDDTIDVNNNGIPDGCDGCTDNDNDGICEEDDCDDNDSNFPMAPGTPCDDGNAQTNNDVILSNGCTCQGTIEPPSGTYCESEGDFPWSEWIEGVQLNSLNNISGKSHYSDFTNLSTTLNSGASYNISLTAGYSYTTYDEYFTVWIDYNQDFVFASNEIAYTGIVSGLPNGTDTGVINGLINVPPDALNGITRMRVSMSRDLYADPCSLITFGEVEDYSVIIESGNSTFLTLNNCADDIVHTAEVGETSMIVNWNSPTATTTCSPNTIMLNQTGPVSGSSFEVGTTTEINYIAMDECGNQQTCSFSVTINPPISSSISLNCPNDISVVSGAGQSGATINWTEPNGSTTCPNGGLSIVQTSGPANGAFFSVGTYQITYHSFDICSNVEDCSFSITVLPEATGGDYCESESNFPYHDWIEIVQFNTINNSSGKSSYSDFTNISTTIPLNSTNSISLTTGYSWTTYDEYWKVWIDYNQNGIFEEPAEIAFSGILNAPPNGTEIGTISGSVVIPESAMLGLTRIRVSMNRESEPSPCDILPFGEVEDYSIEISSPFNGLINQNENEHNSNQVSILEEDAQQRLLSIYPNPTKGILFLQAPKLVGLPATLTVYNHLGQIVTRVETESLPSTAIEFDLKNQKNGFYYVVIKAEGRKLITKKFIIEDLR